MPCQKFNLPRHPRRFPLLPTLIFRYILCRAVAVVEA